MNRGYFAYVKESKKAVKQTLKQKLSYFRFYAWLLISFFGKLLILPACIMDLSSVKLSKDVLNNQEISVFDSFNGATNGKSFWALFVSKILVALIFAAWLVVIFFASMLIYSLIQVIALTFLNLGLTLVIFYLIITLLSITFVIFLLTFALRFAPNSYVAYTDENVSVSNILSKSYKSTKNSKGVIFFNAVRPVVFITLNVYLTGLILFAFEWFVYTFFTYEAFLPELFRDSVILLNYNLALQGTTFTAFDINPETLDLVCNIFYVVEFALIVLLSFRLLKRIAKNILVYMAANYALFEDIVDDKYNTNKRAVGVYVSKNKGVSVKKLKVEDVFRSAEDISYDKNEPTLKPRLLKDLSDVIDFDTLNKDTEVKE